MVRTRFSLSLLALLAGCYGEVIQPPSNEAPSATNDALGAAEDVPRAISTGELLANDTDPDGDTLSVVAVSNAVNGTVSLAGGVVTFEPSPDFNGPASFQYTISDGLHSVSASVSLDVEPVNDAPKPVNDAFNGNKNSPLLLSDAQLLANDVDPDGDSLSVLAVTDAVNGTVSRSGGLVTFTPTPGFTGNASFQYTATDGALTRDAAVFLTIGEENQPPIAVGDSFAGVEDVPLSLSEGQLLANDLDPDGDVLFLVDVFDASNGTASFNNGQISFVPAANFNGVASFDYLVSDDNGGTITGSVLLNFAPVNDPPSVVEDTVSIDEDQSFTVSVANLLLNASDIDSANLSILAAGSGVNGVASLANGVVNFVPNANFNGGASFTYLVFDGAQTALGVVSVLIDPVEDAPLAADDTANVNEDAVLTLSKNVLVANDLDADGDTLQLAAVSAGVGGSVAISGNNVVFTPNANSNGAASFQYTVSDGTLTDTGLVSVTVAPVNDAPTAVGDNVNTGEDQPLALDQVVLVGNDIDIDLDPLIVSAVSSPVNGAVSLAGGVILFTPTKNFNGAASFQYTVSDGNGGTDTGLVTVDVGVENDAPVAVDDEQTTNEDTALVVSGAILVANDTDNDEDPLSVVAVSAPVNGAVSLLNGVVTFTPNANFNGAASFQYTVTDGNGGSDTGLVSVTVLAVNDAPLAVDDAISINEDNVANTAKATLLANDTDVDNGVLNLVAVANAVNGSVVISGNNVVFTPDANFNGTASYEYTVSDGALTDIGRVVVTVLPVNDAPLAGADSIEGTEDTPTLLNDGVLLANDSDIDGNPLSIVSVANGSGGSVSLVGDVVTFTPEANFNGAASFQYTISDGALTASATVTVNVAAVEDAPVAVDDTATVNEDATLTVANATLLANDLDADGDTLQLTAVSAAVNGSVSIVGNNVVFTPNANFNGPASFQYTVFDGTLTDTGLVSVTVAPVNDPPVADAKSVTVNENSLNNVIALTGSDVDGNSLSFSVVTGPTRGTLGAFVSTGATSATVTYTPNANQDGADSFTVRASDGTTNSAPALISITINNVPRCGDGALDLGETCDDANANNGDGCSSLCATETGFSCAGAPSVCTAICGDGLLVGGESCDDANANNGDGCSSLCSVEGGFNCAGVPSVCTPDAACGNGIVEAGEECDDGDADDTNGCTVSCVIAPICNATEIPGAARFVVDSETGHCYAAFDNVQTTFADAQTACIADGGHLVAITSSEENSVVLSIHAPGQNPWIGAQEDGNDTDAIFAWVTGEAFSFANFAANQPDDDIGSGGSGEALHLVNDAGQWNDTNPNFTGFVKGRLCEYEP